MRALAFALACALAATAAGAPVPKPKDIGFYKPGWDRPIDPDKDCRFTVSRGELTIEVPAKVHELYANFKLANAPRLLRNVTGDFSVEVRVTGPFHATEKSTLKGQPAYTTAGLIIDTGDPARGSFRFDFGMCRYQRALVTLGQVYNTTRGRSGTWGTEGPGYYSLLKGAKAAYLRIERRGNAIYPAVSADGKKWTPRPWFELKYPHKVKVGLIVTSTSNAPLKVTFDRFKLTRAEPRRQK
jgi:regulation of enolase protein 1 (concanavalin A-like superfamily)